MPRPAPWKRRPEPNSGSAFDARAGTGNLPSVRLSRSEGPTLPGPATSNHTRRSRGHEVYPDTIFRHYPASVPSFCRPSSSRRNCQKKKTPNPQKIYIYIQQVCVLVSVRTARSARKQALLTQFGVFKLDRRSVMGHRTGAPSTVPSKLWSAEQPAALFR